MCVHDVVVCVHVCVVQNSPPHGALAVSQEVSVDSETALGGVVIPDISVTGVSSERIPNGESLRPRSDGRTHPDGETLGGASEVSPEPRSHESSLRGQEVRRQKSLRRMMENESSGSASIGRSQH